MKLKWTNGKPTVAGWYWYGEPGHDFEKDKECVKVLPDGAVWRTGIEWDDHVNDMNGLFAGPIPEPTE